MTVLIRQGVVWFSTVQNGICQCAHASFRRGMSLDFRDCPPTNVSCDDTELPARSSDWTPVTSPTRNSLTAHDFLILFESAVIDE